MQGSRHSARQRPVLTTLSLGAILPPEAPPSCKEPPLAEELERYRWLIVGLFAVPLLSGLMYFAADRLDDPDRARGEPERPAPGRNARLRRRRRAQPRRLHARRGSPLDRRRRSRRRLRAGRQPGVREPRSPCAGRGPDHRPEPHLRRRRRGQPGPAHQREHRVRGGPDGAARHRGGTRRRRSSNRAPQMGPSPARTSSCRAASSRNRCWTTSPASITVSQ